jgi:hypothetical protein
LNTFTVALALSRRSGLAVPLAVRSGDGIRDIAGGRPKVPLEIRRLIREMSLANPLWGAPRFLGELLPDGTV